MGKRRRSRQTALQLLYAAEFLGEPPSEIARKLMETGQIAVGNWTSFCRDLTDKTLAQRETLDAEIKRVLAHWRLERLSKVDLMILRLALCEMREFPDIPIRVTLNEYIELAKEFGTEDSSAFVNGILDRLGRQFAEKDFDPHERISED